MLKEVLAHEFFAMWPSVALVIFSAVMLGVFAWIWRPHSTKSYQRAARLVHEDEHQRGGYEAK